MIDATNAEDTQAFLAAFAEDAVVDDFGRKFIGPAQIKAWSDRENIGTHNQIEVTSISRNGESVVLHVLVSGAGYNGGGTFTITTSHGTIRSLIIRG